MKIENKRMTEEHEKKKMLDNKIEELKYRKAETMKLLNRVYSLGVVQKKYCNFIAIGTLYEYFANGRTVSLELTPNDKGAYNLYEEESRMEKVITRLDIVVSRLNSIRTMQSFIYNAITDSQRQLDSIQESINRLGEYNQRIINQNRDTNRYLSSLVDNNSTFRIETY